MITILFFVFLFLKVVIQVLLNKRNISHVLRNRAQVPEDFKDQINLDEHQKAADYTVAKNKFGNLSLIFEVVILLLWLPAGLLNRLDLYIQTLSDNEIYRGLLVFAAFLFLNFLISLPEKLYSTFVLEEKFGFNKTTPKIFVTDLMKGMVVGSLIGFPFLYMLLKIMTGLGTYWWVWAWAFMMSFQILMLWAYPSVIAPLFNKFSELDNQDLKSVIEKLLTKIGFEHSGIFVMDASKRSSHGNAYFTGFGKTKRIVFFDTLLKQLNPEELEAVLAHELGHFKLKHIFKMILFSAILSFIGFAVIGKLYFMQDFYQAHFISTQSSYMALLLFSLVSPLYTFFLTPITASRSRKHEYEADSFAAKYSDANQLVKALVKLYKENASTLTPDPMYSKFYYSHPTANERIFALKKLGEST
jgi:STE24 endopeptidase